MSEDCSSTHSGVTIKSIYELQDVATHLGGVTLDTTDYKLCYDFKTWTEFEGF